MRILLFVFMFYFSNPINVLKENSDYKIEFEEIVMHEECSGHYLSSFSYSSDCEVSDINVKIYNRWGNIVTEITEPNFSWKGTWNDKYLPDGEYYYICILQYKNQEKYKYHEGKIRIYR